MPEKQSNEMTLIRRTGLGAFGGPWVQKEAFVWAQAPRDAWGQTALGSCEESRVRHVVRAYLTVALIVVRSAIKSSFWWALWATVEHSPEATEPWFWMLSSFIICCICWSAPWGSSSMNSSTVCWWVAGVERFYMWATRRASSVLPPLTDPSFSWWLVCLVYEVVARPVRSVWGIWRGKLPREQVLELSGAREVRDHSAWSWW